MQDRCADIEFLGSDLNCNPEIFCVDVQFIRNRMVMVQWKNLLRYCHRVRILYAASLLSTLIWNLYYFLHNLNVPTPVQPGLICNMY